MTLQMQLGFKQTNAWLATIGAVFDFFLNAMRTRVDVIVERLCAIAAHFASLTITLVSLADRLFLLGFALIHVVS